MKNEEHKAQVAVINWCRLAKKDFPQASRIFAIPNGSLRHPGVARKLKAEGVRPGCPDLFLPVARGGMNGLFIEMKVKPNRPTVEQMNEMQQLYSSGYAVFVCYSSSAAIERIQEYLALN